MPRLCKWRSNWITRVKKNQITDGQACFLVGEYGLVVPLVETYGCPSKKEGGSNFVHTVNIGDVVSCYKCSQGSNPASEAPVERRSVP